MYVKSFRDLSVWQKSMELAKATYEFTDNLPNDEKYGLTSQLKRAAVSIPSNIAEGQGRDSSKDFLRFLSVARGSLHEVITQIELCILFGLAKREQASSLLTDCDEIGRMLRGLQKSIGVKVV